MNQDIIIYSEPLPWKTVIDRISQPNWSVIIVYSDWTTEVKKKSDLKNTLLQAKIRWINKK